MSALWSFLSDAPPVVPVTLALLGAAVLSWAARHVVLAIFAACVAMVVVQLALPGTRSLTARAIDINGSDGIRCWWDGVRDSELWRGDATPDTLPSCQRRITP